MLPIQFFSQNLHFTICLFVGLVCFAAFWLYFDAWTNRHHAKDMWKWVGFLLLSLGFLIHATNIEQNFFGRPLLGNLTDHVSLILRSLGYLGLILGHLTDPLQAVPKNKGLELDDNYKKAPANLPAEPEKKVESSKQQVASEAPDKKEEIKEEPEPKSEPKTEEPPKEADPTSEAHEIVRNAVAAEVATTSSKQQVASEVVEEKPATEDKTTDDKELVEPEAPSAPKLEEEPKQTKKPETEQAPEPEPKEETPEAKEPKKPKTPKKKSKKINVMAVMAYVKLGLPWVPFGGSLIVMALYFRRAGKGLERHLRPVGVAFLLFSLSEFAHLGELLRTSPNPIIYRLVAPFGAVWYTEHILLLLGAVILGKWVWHYLIDRFLSQLFITFTAMVMLIFLITTNAFTFLLVRNIQNDALANLQVTANTLNYAIVSKQGQTHSAAEVVAESPSIIAAAQAKDHKTLIDLTRSILVDKQLSSLVLTSDSGQVLLRAEDPTRWADSLSDDPAVRRALVGTDSSTIVTHTGVVAPTLLFQAAVPLRNSSGTIVGSVEAALAADNSLVDGIKSATGLDSALYSGNVRAATTLYAPDGKSRGVGVKETDATVNQKVLKDGKTFAGSLTVLNRSYLAVYTPLKDVDNTVIGMLFIGQPQVNILQTVGRSIELTFLVATAMLVLSVIPAYLVAKYLAYQLE